MKCPICDRELPNDVVQCTLCGFNQFHKEFVNHEEYEEWMEETVVPCRIVGKTLLRQLIDETKVGNDLRQRILDLSNQKLELQDEVIRLSRQILEMQKK